MIEMTFVIPWGLLVLSLKIKQLNYFRRVFLKNIFYLYIMVKNNNYAK